MRKFFFLEKQKNKPVHSYERRNKIIRIMTTCNWFFFQLDIMEPKIPEDIYKSHLEQTSKTVLGFFFNEIANFLNELLK